MLLATSAMGFQFEMIPVAPLIAPFPLFPGLFEFHPDGSILKPPRYMWLWDKRGTTFSAGLDNSSVKFVASLLTVSPGMLYLLGELLTVYQGQM